MKQLYVVHHERELPDGYEDVKLIGVYSDEARANAAVERSKDLIGFREYPEGFTVNKHQLDRDGWTEGFVTVP